MSTNPIATRATRSKKPLLVALGILIAAALFALGSSIRTRIAQRAAHNAPNPVSTTPENLAAAKQNYNSHCASCHGVAGDGKGDKSQGLWNAPTDFRNAARMSRRTDGDFYWVTTRGNWPMPAFENRLTDLERWQLALYIRTFSHQGTEPDKN
jgi:mono/diheme cytochrome c family protein